MLRRLLAGLIAALLGGCALRSARGFVDDFSSRNGGGCVPDGGRIGRWSVESTGFGCVMKTGDGWRHWLQASTTRAARPSRTHAFLLTGPGVKAPFTLSARVNTVEQNRDGSAANAWESAWLVWSFTDRKHFYYFAAKRDGWELGKRDPAYYGGQRFLADGKSPSFPLGTWATITVAQGPGPRIRVYVDGKQVSDFTDVERPYGAGKIGLYGEDCLARFDDVSVVRGQ